MLKIGLTTLLLGALALGQAAVGTITGSVQDPQQKAVPGAQVTATNTALGSHRSIATDRNGHFTLAQLPPGGYSVTATAPGLQLRRAQTVALGVGGSVQVTLRLDLASGGQQITVSAAPARVEGQTIAPVVDKHAATVANAIAGLTVTYLPNRDRDFTQFAALAAGAQETDTGVEVDGQRANAAQTEVDGADFDDPLEGGRRGGADGGFFFPQTVVQEFQLVHEGVTADVGDTNGGLMNVATKAGSDRIHGEQFYIFRPAALTGSDAFGHSLSDTQNEIGGSIGGALKPGRIFYYVGGEQDFVNVPYYTEFQPQAGGVTVPAALANLQGQTVGRNDPTALSLRLDFVIDNHNTLNLEGNYNRISYSNVNPDSTQVSAVAAHGNSLSGQSDWIHANWTAASGSGAVNQLVAQWAGDRRDLMPLSTAPEQYINGFGTLGGDSLGPHRFISRQRGGSDDLAITWRGQTVHFGGGFAQDPGSEEQQANLNGRYDYASLADYLANNPLRFQRTFATSAGSLLYTGTVHRGDAYVVDRIPFGEKLTLSAGLRWEGQWNPQPPQPNTAIPGTSAIPNDLQQWQPRLGLAWNPNSSTVIRLSSGLYDAPTPATYFARVFTDNGLNTEVADSLYDPQVLALAAPGQGLTAAPAGLTVPAALAASIAPNFRNPRSLQAGASVQRQLNPRFDLTTGYTHDSSWNLLRTLNANLDPPTLDATGMPIFPATRPLPAVGQLLRFDSSAHSTYDGWLSTLNVKGPYRLTLTANYTLARTRDDNSTEGPFDLVSTLNPFNLAAEAADSNQDIRHSFNLSATDNLPLGFKINPVFVALSGLPYTPIVGFDTQNDGNDFNDRAVINGDVAARNSLRQPAQYDLDLRFVKDITLRDRGHHLDLFMDIFNVLNTGNRTFGPGQWSAYGTAASPVFSAGMPLFAPSTVGFGGPRQVQFTARLVGF